MMDESLRASDSWRATRSDYWCDYGDMTNGDLDNPATPLWKHIHGAFDTGIKLTSQTYRFSAYTVFIKVGNAVTGDPNSADATQVYGQWNGTDLSFQQQWWASHVQDHAGWGGGYIACGD